MEKCFLMRYLSLAVSLCLCRMEDFVSSYAKQSLTYLFN